MVKIPNAVLTCIVLGFITGCSTESAMMKEPLPGSKKIPPSLVAAVDWSKAKLVTITLSDYSFTPEKIEFQRGISYKLRLENKGDRDHDFASEGFFKAIAIQKLRSQKGEVNSPYLTLIDVEPGSVKELYFVAAKLGSYDLECSIFLHAFFGMEGRIIIL